MPTSLQNLDYASESDVWAVLEVSKLPPNVPAYNNVSGTNTEDSASVAVVRAPSGTLLTAPGYAVNVYDLFVEYPIDEAGNYVDCELKFQIGEVEVSRVVLSAGFTRNMYPQHDRLYGGPRAMRPFSESMRKLYNHMQKGAPVRNLALRITGFQIPSQQALKVTFVSKTGWGVTNPPVRPLRLYMLGDMWTDSELARFQSMYRGDFSVRRHPDGIISGSHQLPKALTSATMGILPNGTEQTHTTQIYRKITWAVNNNPITIGSEFVYSSQTAVGGQQNNVSDSRHDLGLPYKGTTKAFIPYELGFNFAESLVAQGTNPQIFVGWWNSATKAMIPDMHANGLLISAQRNRFQYGSVRPQVAAANQMFALPDAQRLVSMLVQDANWAPAVSAIGLATGYDAGSIYAMMGGVEVIGL